MFTFFAFSEEYNEMKDVIHHLGPQMEDLINLTIYNFPEKYKDDIRGHMAEPEFTKVLKGFILEAYHELKELHGRQSLLDKWQVYNRAAHKIRKFFIRTLKNDMMKIHPWEGQGTDVY